MTDAQLSILANLLRAIVLLLGFLCISSCPVDADDIQRLIAFMGFAFSLVVSAMPFRVLNTAE